MNEESTREMVILPGITSSGTRNPEEESNSTRNYQLMDKESTRERGFLQESLA
jgi:hypothetical protein